jgi:tripeptidyl-peptidase I
MTADEVVDFFAPEQSTAEAVMGWLVDSGISPDRFALSANKQVNFVSQ